MSCYINIYVAIFSEIKPGMHDVTGENILVEMGPEEQMFEIIWELQGIWALPITYMNVLLVLV